MHRAGDLAGSAAGGRPAASGRVRRVLLRLTWGLADQGMSSLTNFAVTIYVARTLGAVDFGAYSLAYVTYSFALNASRGLATDPLMVRFSGADVPAWRRAVASSSGTALLVGLMTGGLALATAMLLNGTTREAFIALGITLPGLLLQDSWRYAFFALGRGSRAFLNDTVWAVTMLPALVWLHFSGHASVFTFVLTWGAAATVGAAIGPLQARVLPQPRSAWAWIRRNKDLGPRYLAENTANSEAGQVRSYAVGLIVGLAAVGYVQAASTLMGPFLVVFMGMSLVTIPEAARILRHSPAHMRLFCAVVGIGLALGAVAWGAALLIALPRGLGAFMLGSLWRPTYPLILPMTISMIGACLIAGATTGLHALGAARRSLRAMALSSGTYLVCGVAGAATGGALGAVRGAAVATCLGALVWWRQLGTALREAKIASRRGRTLMADIGGTAHLGVQHYVIDLMVLGVGLAGVPEPVLDGGGPAIAGERPVGYLAGEVSAGLARLPSLAAAVRRRLVFCCAAAAVGMMLGGAAYVVRPPAYKASTSVLLAQNPAANPLDAVQTDVALAQSSMVAEPVLRKVGATENIFKFIGSYSVVAVTDRVLEITASGPSSGQAVGLARALAAEFLRFRAHQLLTQQHLAISSLDASVNLATQRTARISAEIARVSRLESSPAQQAELAGLLASKRQALAAQSGLQQAEASYQASSQVTTLSMIAGSRVLDAAAPLARSKLRSPMAYALAGTMAGLLVGIAVVITGELVSGRLRRRDDIAIALGAPVELSAVRPHRIWPRGLAAARSHGVQRIVRYLRGALARARAGEMTALAVVALDDTRAAALSVASLAVALAGARKHLLVADLATGAPAARLLGVRTTGVSTVTVAGQELTVAVPEPGDVARMGPLVGIVPGALGHQPTRRIAAGPLAAVCLQADVMITLVTLDPALRAENLPTWAAGAVVTVTAGKSSGTKIHAAGEMIRLAGTPLISAVVLDADKADESLGRRLRPVAAGPRATRVEEGAPARRASDVFSR